MKTVVKGNLVTPDHVLAGEVVIEDDRITCAAARCSELAGTTRDTLTNGYIFPGLIDVHNHVTYTVFPECHPPKRCQNWRPWQRSSSDKVLRAPCNALKQSVFCEMVKMAGRAAS